MSSAFQRYIIYGGSCIENCWYLVGNMMNLQVEDQLTLRRPFLGPYSYDLSEASPNGGPWHGLSKNILGLALVKLWVPFPTSRKWMGNPHFTPHFGTCWPLKLQISRTRPTIFFKLCTHLAIEISFQTVYATIPLRHCEWHLSLSGKGQIFALKLIF